MSLRRRLILMAVIAVGLSTLLASIVTYYAMRDQLRGEVDSALVAQEHAVGGRPIREQGSLQAPPPRQGGRPDYLALVTATGLTQDSPDPNTGKLTVTGEDVAVARGERERFFSDRTRQGERLRVLSAPLRSGDGAIVIGRSLESVNRVLDRMRWILLLIGLAATAAAVGASRLLAREVLAPISDLTEAAEHIEATGDLGRRVPEAGDDEVGRLAGRFNGMLGRLQSSQEAQRQLVADASHELRTPVTALRTNAEVLRESPRMKAADRKQLLDDVVAQTEELSEIVADVIELARGDAREEVRQDVALDELVAESVQRAGRHAKEISFETELDHCVVEGDPARLARAINNLLDNAAKYSPPGKTVEVGVKGGVVTVRDHGPGISEEELPRVFERFYRGAEAREHHGSGLGLAIVKQVAESHDGTIAITRAEGGGTIATLTLPSS